jgi:hypothetical protein
MNRAILGILCGIVFSLLDAAMVVFGNHPDKSLAMPLQAFFSCFAIGFLAANWRSDCTQQFLVRLSVC